MKDALGHGSNAHNTGVDQIGKPVLSPKVVQGILSTPPGQGFTMRLKDGAAPPKGYQVAIPGHALPAPAIKTGTSRNQVSIWDNRKGREIKTGGTGD
jgi:hypothetical protein